VASGWVQRAYSLIDQSTGFAHAAHHLQKEWHYNPDTLPFAKHYEPNQLWDLIADGFQLDETMALVTNEPARWSKFLENTGGGYLIAFNSETF